MTEIDNNFWVADKGCFIVNKVDQIIIGENMYLGELDDINNYEDLEYTEEVYNNFYKDLEVENRYQII